MKKTNILKLIVVSALAIIIAVASSSVSLGATYNYKATNILDNLSKDGNTVVIPYVFSKATDTLTVAKIRKDFEAKGLTIKKLTRSGNETKADIAGTGTKITVNQNSLTYNLLIYGDVNGDGELNIFDAQDIIFHIKKGGVYALDGLYLKAANVCNDDNTVNIFDAQNIIFTIKKNYKLVDEDIVITPPDTKAPVITIKGNNPTYVEAKSTYKDSGATASDDFDGDISSKITTTGVSSVNTSKLGTYYVKYNVSDAAGNKATEKKRTVIVRDTKAPTITLKGNKTNTVEVGGTFTDLGVTVTDAFEGDISNKVTVSGDAVKTNVVGTYTIKYNAKDTSGNKATEVTRTVKVVDTTKPEIQINGDATVHVDGGSVYEDAGAVVTDNYDASVELNVTNPVDTSVPGTYVVKYNAKDTSGNKATEVTRTVIVDSLPIEALDVTEVTTEAETNTNFVIARVKEADRQTYRTAITVDALTVESSSDALTLATSLNTDNEVVITGTTQTTGSYTVTLTLGEITETIDVTVTKNAIVDSVAIAEIGETDVRIGKNTEKALTFKNENNEEVSVMAKYLTVTASENITVTKLDENRNEITNVTDDVKYIRIRPTASAEAGEDNASITLTVEDDDVEIATANATTTETFSINAESVLTTVTVAPTTTIRENQVSPISLTFLNQDGEEMDDILASDIAFSEDIFNSNTDKKIAVLTPEAEIVEMPGETLEALKINTYRVTATDEIITGNNLFTYIGARIKDTELSGMPMTINREDLKGKSITIKYRTANGIETISTTIVIPD